MLKSHKKFHNNIATIIKLQMIKNAQDQEENKNAIHIKTHMQYLK
jgi:hypothetical protein